MYENAEVQCQYCTTVLGGNLYNHSNKKMVIKKGTCEKCTKKIEKLLSNYDTIMKLVNNSDKIIGMINANIKLTKLTNTVNSVDINNLAPIPIPEGYQPNDTYDNTSVPKPPKEE